MEYLPVKTRVLKPPQDDLLAVLGSSLPALQEEDIVLISSKVVAIHEGCAVAMGEIQKSELIAKAADLIIPRPYFTSPLTVAHHAFLGAAGIDESNGNGYYILLPEDPCASADRVRAW